MDNSSFYNDTSISDIFWENTEYPTATSQNCNIYIFPNATTKRQPSTIAKFYPVIAAEMVLSVLCLVFSLKIYNILPEFKNVHGKNLTSLSCCLLITYIFLTMDLILRKYAPPEFCFCIAIMIHITFLAYFFWTNVMAFDIWKSITSIRSKSKVSSQSKKYFKYSLYAWTATIVTTIPAAVFHSTELIPFKYRPKFGEKRCWLNGITAFIYYFNMPVGVILFANLIMFILTVRKLWIIKKSTAILPVKRQEKQLYLYLKLFLIMGITWMTEFIPWVTETDWLYAVAGMLTALHGVLLFIIFVLRKRILREAWVRLKYGKLPDSSKKDSSTLPTLSSSVIQISQKES